MIVARRHPGAPADPGDDVLIALVEQRLVAVEIRVVEAVEVPLAEPPEDDVALAHAAIEAAIGQALLAYAHRFAHGFVSALDCGPWV